jgi:hypothetical protein
MQQWMILTLIKWTIKEGNYYHLLTCIFGLCSGV